MKLYKKLIQLHAEKEFYELCLSSYRDSIIWLSSEVVKDVKDIRDKLENAKKEIQTSMFSSLDKICINRRHNEIIIYAEKEGDSYIFNCFIDEATLSLGELKNYKENVGGEGVFDQLTQEI